MKPSERIKEIFNKWHPNNPNKTEIGIADDWVSSIITYLDEQYEQEKPCETCNDNEILTCTVCGRKATKNAYGETLLN